MSRLSATRRSIAVLIALTATLSFSTSGALGRPDVRLAGPTVIKDQPARDSDAVTRQFDARSMKIAPQADRGQKVQISISGPRLRVGQRLNLMDLTILNGAKTDVWRAMWLLPRDGDRFAGLRLWDQTKSTDERPYGQRINCPGHKARRVRTSGGLTLQMTIPRSCIADPAKIRVNGKLWYIIRYNERTGLPRQGHADGVPNDEAFTKAL